MQMDGEEDAELNNRLLSEFAYGGYGGGGYGGGYGSYGGGSSSYSSSYAGGAGGSYGSYGGDLEFDLPPGVSELVSPTSVAPKISP